MINIFSWKVYNGWMTLYMILASQKYIFGKRKKQKQKKKKLGLEVIWRLKKKSFVKEA